MKYTVPQYARVFGYNETYVRHCCNGYIKPDSGWRYRLPKGHIARREGPGERGWYIYVDQLVGESPSSVDRFMPIVRLRDEQALLVLLRERAQSAASSLRPESLELEILPDGSWTCGSEASVICPLDEVVFSEKQRPRAGSIGELISSIWFLELKMKNEGHAREKNPGKSLLNEILTAPWIKQHKFFSTVCGMCLACGQGLGSRRSQARFCSAACRSRHADWIEQATQTGEFGDLVQDRLRAFLM